MLKTVALAAAAATAAAYNNGLAATPPMGWNTWCTDDLCGAWDVCHDSMIRAQAQAMVDSGMADLGYEYIVLDDCWAADERDENGELAANADQFPDGIQATIDFVHGLGLKFGLYTSAGSETCRKGRPGSWPFFDVDAATFAKWGLDFVKADNCHKPGDVSEQDLFMNFSRALNETGHPMVFSLCEWGDGNVTEWGAEAGQEFRVQEDHLPFWHFPSTAAGLGYGQGTSDIIRYVADIKPSSFVEQYGYLDPDFLMTLFWEGTFLDNAYMMDFVNSRTEMTFWSMWAAPLMVATTLDGMSDDKRSIIMNEEVIAIDQDPLFVPADLVKTYDNGLQLWTRPLAEGGIAAVVYNPDNDDSLAATVDFADLGFPDDAYVNFRDIWNDQSLGSLTGNLTTADIGPHDVLLVRAKEYCAGVSC